MGDGRQSRAGDQEAQLRQAERLATIGILASGVAHDFNNILTTIVGRAEMARGELPTRDGAHLHLQCIIEAAHRARGLARQILVFSGHAEQEQRPVQIQLVVWEALELLRATLPANIEIGEYIDFTCKTVRADPTQIYQVFMNLATNAYQAMCTKGGVLEVSLDTVRIDAEHLQPGHKLYERTYVRLTVSDTGQGMSAATMARIFEPFFTTKDLGSGTGLGLSVAQRIVEAHGGEITVCSERGKGTTFQVYLPINDEVSEARVVADARAKGDEHVLVIEEDAAIAHMQERMLGRLGYDVSVRTDRLAALEEFRAQPNGFDVVVAEREAAGLQGWDGFADSLPGIPVILVGGYREEGSHVFEKTPAPDLGDCVLKPVVARDLGGAIRRVLDGAEKEA